MSNHDEFRREMASIIREGFEARTWTEIKSVTLGDENGTVIVPTAAQTRTGALYATGAEEILQLANTRAFIPFDDTLANGTPVLAGKPPGSDVVSVMMPNPGLASFEHFGGALPMQYYAATATIGTPNQFQFMLLKVSSGGGMNIAMTAGWYRRRNTVVFLASQDLGSLAASVPITSGKALWVLVLWKHDTQGVALVVGSEYTPSGTLAITNDLILNCPTAITGADYVQLGAVYLYQGQTALLSSHVIPMQQFAVISAFDPNTILTDSVGNVLSTSAGNVLVEA